MSERPALHYEAQINDTQKRNTDKKKKKTRNLNVLQNLETVLFHFVFFCSIEYSITQYSWANALGHSVSI